MDFYSNPGTGCKKLKTRKKLRTSCPIPHSQGELGMGNWALGKEYFCKYEMLPKRRDFLNHLVLTGTTALTIKGCGGSKEPAVTITPGPGCFKVAIALPQDVNDLGWSRSDYQGLKLIEKELYPTRVENALF